MFRSSFANRREKTIPSSQNIPPIVRQDMRGLDMVTPYSAMQDNRAPFGKNFRVYAEESDGRRVSVQDRRGSGPYSEALGESEAASYTDMTNLVGMPVGRDNNWRAMYFEPSSSGPLTKMELYLQNSGEGQGPIVVQIHEDDGGEPGKKIADSGIYGSALPVDEYGYVTVKFIEAPTLNASEEYWVVLHIQEDGDGYYLWGGNENGDSLESDSSGLAWSMNNESMIYKAYISDSDEIKGMFRYTPEDGQDTTVVAIGTTLYQVDDVSGAFTSIQSGLSSDAEYYSFTQMDDKLFWVNGYDDMKTWDGNTVETITHSQLPILSLIETHKELLFGVAADEKNRIIWSEAPGNDDGDGNFWYEAYLSTSFFYIPRPRSGQVITSIISWQDSLQVFLDSDKYVLHGDTPAQFRRRQALGRKGAVSESAMYADENFIYFLADDGVYRYNGSSDEIISDRVQPEIEGISPKRKAYMTKWKRQLRLYYSSPLSGVNDRCLLFHTVLEEWEMDTDSFVSHALPLVDIESQGKMIEASSVCPRLTYAEEARDNLGKAIDFEYHCKYDSMNNPAIRKRITRFFPLLEGENGSYSVKVGLDKDLEDTTRYTDFPLETQGIQIGDFLIGDGMKVGRIFSFAPVRIRVSGQGYFWQVRIKKRAINNPIKFNGYVLAIRAKRL